VGLWLKPPTPYIQRTNERLRQLTQATYCASTSVAKNPIQNSKSFTLNEIKVLSEDCYNKITAVGEHLTSNHTNSNIKTSYWVNMETNELGRTVLIRNNKYDISDNIIIHKKFSVTGS